MVGTVLTKAERAAHLVQSLTTLAGVAAAGPPYSISTESYAMSWDSGDGGTMSWITTSRLTST